MRFETRTSHTLTICAQSPHNVQSFARNPFSGESCESADTQQHTHTQDALERISLHSAQWKRMSRLFTPHTQTPSTLSASWFLIREHWGKNYITGSTVLEVFDEETISLLLFTGNWLLKYYYSVNDYWSTKLLLYLLSATHYLWDDPFSECVFIYCLF